MGREKSDGRIVPEGRRKAVPTAKTRGGKATTVSKQAAQLDLFSSMADSPQGANAEADPGQPGPAPSAAPEEESATGQTLPAMTMEEVASWFNLNEALDRVESNKGAPGPNRQTIDDVVSHWEMILPKLQTDLVEGNTLSGNIRRVWLPKPGGGKRGLGIPNVIDRIVQQAVGQVLSPHYERTFHGSSHGFRPGRSCHTAITEAKGYVGKGFGWVVDLDLKQFFDQVCHDRLLGRLTQRVSDKRLLKLIRRMLQAKVVMPNGVVVSTEKGTPQGGPLSPLLSNIVLDELDWELDRRGHRFVRYADDCNIYVRSERAGARVMASITRFIEKRLRLEVNGDKSAVARPEERHFLGFSLQANLEEDTVEVLLSTRSKERLRQRVRELTPRGWGQSLRGCIWRLNLYLRGWMGSFRIISERERMTLTRTDAHIRRRLRALLLKHWRRKRTRARRLIAMGARPKTAWATIYGGNRRLWWLSNAGVVNARLTKAFFAERGLKTLASLWK